ncbi:2-phospho-L-lactate transferase [Rhizobium sp. L1K21]|uniref:2-phospho-L-lactate transferase n=1 Tax=Rhizobium sp. L1K21 TaxID=2954933 RepID=UPI0020935E23|nr:2-phospho-L-lactate transferase [Rhizobium sp. L1K21]MCO6187498.1 2-phospho-L-lactate transferase [Rhizobium sp. L1K21]
MTGRPVGPDGKRQDVSVTKNKVIAISGGVGGAKLSMGLASEMDARNLTVIVNTGDDSWHFGLFVTPDIDTQLYTLSGRADLDRGWGRSGETWHAMDALRELGEDVWFNIGDKDIATNLLRTMRLSRGDRLTEITADFARAFGIETRLLPMSDMPVSTQLKCADGDYDFHDWFVAARAEPTVQEVVFRGAERASMTAEVETALADPELAAIVVCPSNPFLSIGPVLSVPGLRQMLKDSPAPVIGVTPVVSGQAIKGPTAAMMKGFGLPVSASAAARFHADIFDGYILDERDAGQVGEFAYIGSGLPVALADTMMVDLDAKRRLARAVLEFAETLR